MNRHVVREVIRQLRESGCRGVIAVALIAVAAAWAGALLIARARVEQHLLRRDQPAVAVASLGAGESASEAVEALRSRFPAARVRLLEPDATRDELANWFPELTGFFERLEEASFPTLLEVEVEPAQATAVVEFLRARPEVALAESSLAWQGDLMQTLRRATIAGLGIAFALRPGHAEALAARQKPGGFSPVHELLKTLTEDLGTRVYVCASCVKPSGLDPANLAFGAQVRPGSHLGQLLQEPKA